MRRLILFIALAFLSLTATAAQSSASGPVAMPVPELLADPESELDWRSVEGQDGWQQQRFARTARRLPSGSLWLRWRLPAQSLGDHRLRLAPPQAGELEIRVFDGKGQTMASYRVRGDTPIAQRPLQSAAIVIPWPGGRGPWTVLARQSADPMAIYTPAIESAMPGGRPASSLTPLLWASASACATLFMLALLLALTSRDQAQLALAALLCTLTAWAVQQSGAAFEWLWPEHGEWNLHARHLTAALLTGSGAWVAHALFANSSSSWRWCTLTLRASIALALACAATVSMIPATVTAVATLCVMLLTGIGTLPIAVVRARAGDRSMPFLLAAIPIAILSLAPSHAALIGLRMPYGWPEATVLAALPVLASLSFSVAVVMRHYSRERLGQIARAGMVSEQSQALKVLEQTVGARTFELEVANAQLARQTRVDGLTGVFNRRHFDESLLRAVHKAHECSGTLAVMMIDLDHFKRLNDDHGHAFGDECLIRAGRLAMAAVPDSRAMVARYGGEEFVVLIEPCAREDALAIAEAIRAAIEAEMPESQGLAVRMTASIGVCCGLAESARAGPQMLARADEALYAAKHGGRNQVREAGAVTASAKPAIDAHRAAPAGDGLTDAGERATA
ncbi:MAG: diguanylate cyclase [Burkholderiaceae bacterium]